MRDILFRGKRHNGEWVEGGYIPLDVESGYAYIVKPYPYASSLSPLDIIKLQSILIIPETVGQYTGLIDRNGKKIFEGDILNCITSDFDGSDKKVYNFKVTKITDYEQMGFLDFCNEIEIIGNIHDNPNC